jgi:hypothetical protein
MPTARCNPTWAMLIKRIYEVDPLTCPKCSGTMKVLAFIEAPQGAVIEKILRHCGLWNPAAPRPPPDDGDGPDFPGESVENGTGPFESSDWTATEDFPERSIAPSGTSGEWTYMDIDTFEATF